MCNSYFFIFLLSTDLVFNGTASVSFEDFPMENNASMKEAKTVIAIDCLAAMRSKRRSLWNCQGEGVRGHSPSRLTCTSAPTFCLDCCVFQ